jgi:hypothetical protein
MKTSELTGVALDYAVDLIEGSYAGYIASHNRVQRYKASVDMHHKPMEPMPFAELYGRTVPKYSESWVVGGPIIEREKISIGYERYGPEGGETWDAVKKASHEDTTLSLEYGPTPLIAAMRCYVASKLGGEVEIPEELR